MRDYIITIKQSEHPSLSDFVTAPTMVEAFSMMLSKYPEVARQHNTHGGTVTVDILTLGDSREQHIDRHLPEVPGADDSPGSA